MSTRILFFGPLETAAGAEERIVDLPAHVTDARTLVEWIADGDDDLKFMLSARTVRIVIDQVIIPPAHQFEAPSEIAFLPPFSGG